MYVLNSNFLKFQSGYFKSDLDIYELSSGLSGNLIYDSIDIELGLLIGVHCPLIVVDDNLNYLKLDRNLIKNIIFDYGNFFDGKIENYLYISNNFMNSIIIRGFFFNAKYIKTLNSKGIFFMKLT